METLLWTLGIWIGFATPILAAGCVAIVKGRGVAGRWLFVFVGPVIVYCIVWVLSLLFLAPAYAVLALFAPGSDNAVNQALTWYAPVAWVVRNDGRLALGACAALTVWLVLKLWPRWPHVLAAMARPPSA